MPAHRRSIARVIARHDPGDRTASDRAPLDPIGLDALTGDFFDLTVPTMLMSGQPFGAFAFQHQRPAFLPSFTGAVHDNHLALRRPYPGQLLLLFAYLLLPPPPPPPPPIITCK